MRPPFHIFRKRLPNGLTVLLSRNDKIPMVYINTFCVAGSADNPPGKAGLASFLARMLDEGTRRYTHRQIADTIESLGGDLSAFSNRELTGLSMALLSQHIDKGLELSAEMLRFPTFPEKRLELERQKLTSQIKSSLDNPQAVVSQNFNEVIYQGTPLAEPTVGRIETVGAFRRRDLVDFHRNHFVPARTILCVVGSFQVDEIMDLISRYFRTWKSPARLRPRPRWRFRRQSQPVLRELHLEKEQFNIMLGHLGIERTNPDYYALQILDVILGSGPGFTSRIPQKLRDRMGLAYTTYSDIAGSAGYYPGRFVAFISTSPGNREVALKGLRQEISQIVRKGITRQELANAKSYLTGNFVFDFQSNLHIARFLVGAELFKLGFDYLETYPRLIRGVTQQQVNAVARKYLDIDRCTTIVVGPVHTSESSSTPSPQQAAAARRVGSRQPAVGS